MLWLLLFYLPLSLSRVLFAFFSNWIVKLYWIIVVVAGCCCSHHHHRFLLRRHHHHRHIKVCSLYFFGSLSKVSFLFNCAYLLFIRLRCLLSYFSVIYFQLLCVYFGRTRWWARQSEGFWNPSFLGDTDFNAYTFLAQMAFTVDEIMSTHCHCQSSKNIWEKIISSCCLTSREKMSFFRVDKTIFVIQILLCRVYGTVLCNSLRFEVLSRSLGFYAAVCITVSWEMAGP